MSAMASQITGVLTVYSTVYSDPDQRKHQSSASLAFVGEITGEFPAQRARNAENVSIWLHHHYIFVCEKYIYLPKYYAYVNGITDLTFKGETYIPYDTWAF